MFKEKISYIFQALATSKKPRQQKRVDFNEAPLGKYIIKNPKIINRKMLDKTRYVVVDAEKIDGSIITSFAVRESAVMKKKSSLFRAGCMMIKKRNNTICFVKR